MHTSPATDQTGPTKSTWRPTVTTLLAAAAIALLVSAVSATANRISESLQHGLGHLAVVLPISVVLFAVLRRWPPARPTRPGRLGRRLVVIGLAGLVMGGVLETAGARVDEPGALAVEAVAHTAGQIVTTLSMPVLLAGVLASLLAGAREGDVSWWVVIVVAVVATGLFGLLLIGAPGGG